MKRYFPCAILILLSVAALAQQPSRVKEYMQAFPTYAFSDPSPIPLLSPVYPYFRYDGFTDKAIQKKWKIVELENDYIKVLITPEIGGKIWAAIEKRTGRSFIYYNHTVKFRDVAMRGPWTSGGLEPNYGIIGHTPNCATPVDYTIQKNADGSVSCFVGTLDLLSRSNWRIEINLPADKAYFTTRSFWYNLSPLEQPYYHWMNLGMKSAGNLEFIFPGTRYIGHSGEYADWPLNKQNGKRINFYEENNFGTYKSYHVFGKLTRFFGAYYHDEDNGMVRFANYDDKAGKKIWIWGLSRQGMIWEKMLTDTDGQYVEIQSGRLFNQNAPASSYTPFKHVGFAPYATDAWKEFWYPVSNIKGMVQATKYGALNMKHSDGWLRIYFSPVQMLDDTLTIMQGAQTIYKKRLRLKPLQSFADSVRFAGADSGLHAVVGDQKLEYRNDTSSNLSRPVDSVANFDWSAAYGLYLQGKELMDQKMYDQAEDRLRSSLQKDQHFFPALVKMAALQYRNMRYAEALKFIMHALRIDTHNGEANYYYGLISAELGKLADAKDGFSIAALTTEYRSAAYTELSKLAIKEKNFPAAIGYAEKATDNNRYNMNALLLQAVACRKGKTANADSLLNHILRLDPLNQTARFEQFMLQPSDESRQALIASIKNELPHETFTEIAIWYYNAGFKDEASQLFSMSPTSVETRCWLAYLNNKPFDNRNADLSKSFPFRSETGKVLESLLKKQDIWELKYQLALLYKDRNRVGECQKLLIDCADVPDYAPFYATRAALMESTDKYRTLKDLEKAKSLQPDQWRYCKLLTEYYVRQGSYDSALQTVEPFYRKHADQYIMGMLYAKTLLLNKQYKRSDQVLSGLNIIPFEGATEGRELYRETKLMQAIQLLKSNKHADAKKMVNQAREWPEHLGVGKPYDEDIDDRLEKWLEYLCNQNKTKDNDKLLHQIVSYSNRSETDRSNLRPGNALIAALAMEKLQGRQKAIQWLKQQIVQFPSNEKILTWCIEKLDGKPASGEPNGKQADPNIRLLEAL